MPDVNGIGGLPGRDTPHLERHYPTWLRLALIRVFTGRRPPETDGVIRVPDPTVQMTRRTVGNQSP